MNNLKIEVTQDDIEQGTKRNCNLCPIALAITRVTGKQCFVIPEKIEVYTTLSRVSRVLFYRPTKEAVDFMCAFDDGEEVQPFTFTAEKIV